MYGRLLCIRLIPHRELLDQLYSYGIRGIAHKLLRSYLQDQHQAVWWPKQNFQFAGSKLCPTNLDTGTRFISFT